MNTESLNHHLATVVMGWEETPRLGMVDRDRAYKRKGLPEIYSFQFDPLNNIEQAMGCLDTFDDYDCGKKYDVISGIFYYCRINIKLDYSTKKTYVKDCVKLRAISLASAKATGWKE